MQITINNLTLNLSVTADQPNHNPFAELLEQVRSMVAELPDYVEGTEGDDADESRDSADEERCETVQSAAATCLAVHDFLEGHSRFKCRTFAAIQKAFPDTPAASLHQALTQGILLGSIRTTTRRRDGEPLYEAI